MLEYYKFNGVDQYTEIQGIPPSGSANIWEIYGRFPVFKQHQYLGQYNLDSSDFVFGVGAGNKWWAKLGSGDGTSVVDADTDWHLFSFSSQGLHVDSVLVLSIDAGTFDGLTQPPLIGAYRTQVVNYRTSFECIACRLNGVEQDLSTLIHGDPAGYVNIDGGSTEGLDVFRNPITNDGGLVHNGANVKLRQDFNSWQLLDKISIYLDGVEHVLTLEEHPYHGRGRWSGLNYNITFNGAKWELGGLDSSTNTTAEVTAVPPKAAWPSTGSGKTMTVGWNTNWYRNFGTIIRRDYQSFLDTVNLSDEEALKWIKMAGGGCGLKETAHYNQETMENLTAAEHTKMIAFLGDATCGTLPNPNPAPPFGGFSEGFSDGFS